MIFKSAIVIQYVDQYEILVWSKFQKSTNTSGTVRIGRVLKQFAVDFFSSCPLLSLLKIIGQGGHCENYFYDFKKMENISGIQFGSGIYA